MKTVLAPHLGTQGIFLNAHRITTGRSKLTVFCGGISGLSQLRTDLQRWMKQEHKPEDWFTSMIDFYALPNDFPGYGDCIGRADAVKRVECLEERILRDLPHPRFIPYIQLHEFEALLFAEPRKFEVAFPGESKVASQLEHIRNAFPTPEDIDDRPELAPSKRILSLLPGYRKTVAGPLIIQHIGLARLREECPHFNQWIDRIEKAAR